MHTAAHVYRSDDRHLAKAASLFYRVGSENKTQVIQLRVQYPNPLSYRTIPGDSFSMLQNSSSPKGTHRGLFDLETTGTGD